MENGTYKVSGGKWVYQIENNTIVEAYFEYETGFRMYTSPDVLANPRNQKAFMAEVQKVKSWKRKE